MQALQGLIQGAGQAYQPYFDAPMQQRLWKCLYHPNRFVRELGYELSGDLCSIFAGQPLDSWGRDLALKLQDGLSENWSQVKHQLSPPTTATAPSYILAKSMSRCAGS